MTDASAESWRRLILGGLAVGKSKLPRGLVLAMDHRDPRFGACPRASLSNRIANALEGLRRRIDGVNLPVPSVRLRLATYLTWVIGIFVGESPLTHILLALVSASAGLLPTLRGIILRWCAGAADAERPGRRQCPYEARSAERIGAAAEIDSAAARRLLERRSRAGSCLLLLDALDEVSAPGRRDRIRV